MIEGPVFQRRWRKNDNAQDTIETLYHLKTFVTDELPHVVEHFSTENEGLASCVLLEDTVDQLFFGFFFFTLLFHWRR